MNVLNNKETLLKAYKALESAQQKVSSLSRAQREPIAIIGMGCRFPGGANTPEQFYENLVLGRDSIRPVESERWSQERYVSEGGGRGKAITAQAGWLGAVDTFDAGFFGISPTEARSLDPQQRLLLEVAWESIENAAIRPSDLYGKSVGVYVGVSTFDYSQRFYNAGTYDKIDPYSGTGGLLAPAAGRIAYTLGLSGPAMVVDTACSSSQLAAHLAATALRNRECNAALIGGVNLILTPSVSINFSQANMLSPDGRCFTFDDRANGYVRAEGAGMILVKRLSDAQKDGDRILAVLRGSCVNQDGASGGLTVPSGPSQQAVIRGALAQAGLRPNEISAIEAHGTGTALGDPIEVGALDAVFETANREHPLLLSSVKTQIGHMEAAAGMGSMIKNILALHEETLPPHLHLRQPNKRIPWNDLNIDIPSHERAWNRGELPRRVGISGFGFSGTNVHLVLEEAPFVKKRVAGADFTSKMRMPLLFSAKQKEGLLKMKQSWEKSITHSKIEYNTAARLLACHRTHWNLRSWCRVDQLDSMVSDQADPISERIQETKVLPKIGFLFTGQGAQFSGMGRDFYDSFDTFKFVIDAAAEFLATELEHDLRDLLFDPEYAAQLNETQFSQPALFVLELAFVRLLESFGVRPDYMIGHSLGEWVAATVSGIFDWQDALKLVALRGRLMQALPPEGAMLAVKAAGESLTKRIQGLPGLDLAGFNAPQACTISGTTESIAALEAQLKSEGIRCRRLTVSHAFHSHLMEPMLTEFAQAVKAVTRHSAKIPIATNLDGTFNEHAMEDAAYWEAQIRQPVNFSDGFEALADKADVCIELGPKPILTSFAKQFEGTSGQTTLTFAMSDQLNAEQSFSDLMGTCFSAGVEMNLEALYPENGDVPIFAPTYPFQKERHWTPCPFVDEGQNNFTESQSNYPGRKIPLMGSDEIHIEVMLGADDPQSLQDHKLFGKVVVPAAMHISLILENAGLLWDGKQIEVHDITFPEALVLEESSSRRPVQLAFKLSLENTYTFSVISENAADGALVKHAQGKIVVSDSIQIRSRMASKPDSIKHAGRAFYEKLSHSAYGWGRAYQWVQELSYGSGDFTATLMRPAEGKDMDGITFHPGLIDSHFHPLTTALIQQDKLQLLDKGLFVPYRVGKVIWNGGVGSEDLWTVTGESQVIEDGAIPKLSGRLELRDHSERITVSFEDVEFRYIGKQRIQQTAGLNAILNHWTRRNIASNTVFDPSAKELVLGEIALSENEPPSQILAPYLFQSLSAIQDVSERESGHGIVVKMPEHCDSIVVSTVQSLIRVAALELDVDIILKSETEEMSAVWQPYQDFSESMPLDPNALWVVTGGSGGLAKEVAINWIQNGCRKLILLGRRHIDSEIENSLDLLRRSAPDVEAEYRMLDLSDFDQVNGFINSEKPVGILHLAGARSDAAISSVSASDFLKTLSAKADIAWNLHRATQDSQSLEHFVMFSSIASSFGSAGQAAYAAANGFLDGLAVARIGAQLPAVSINWGLWSGNGMAGELNDSDRNRLENRGLSMLDPTSALSHLRALLKDPQPLHAIFQGDVDTLSESSKSALQKELRRVAKSKSSQDKRTIASESQTRWEEIPQEALARWLEDRIVTDVKRILGIAADADIRKDEGLFALGMDSLMAMDLRNAIQSALELKLSATLLFDYPSIRTLAQYLADLLNEQRSPEVVDSSNAKGSQPLEETSKSDILEDDLDGLSEDDLASLLNDELS